MNLLPLNLIPRGKNYTYNFTVSVVHPNETLTFFTELPISIYPCPANHVPDLEQNCVCAPGFFGDLCTPCANGYFKDVFGASSCLECPYSEPVQNTNWTNQYMPTCVEVGTLEADTTAADLTCPYVISEDYTTCRCPPGTWRVAASHPECTATAQQHVLNTSYVGVADTLTYSNQLLIDGALLDVSNHCTCLWCPKGNVTCLGEFASAPGECKLGSGGPLCAVCEDFYYPKAGDCIQCDSMFT